MPGEALKLVDQIRAQPSLLDAARTNRTELLFVEASAHLAQKRPQRRRGGCASDACSSIPATTNLLATATQVYMKYGRYSNALDTIEQQLSLAPTNMNALVNKGYACIQVGAFEQAIPPLTQVLAVETNNYSALLNRAICLSARRQTRGRPARLRSPAKGLSDRFPDLLRPGGNRLAEEGHQRRHPELPTLPGQCSRPIPPKPNSSASALKN